MATEDVEALSATKRALLEQRMSGRAVVPSPISAPVDRRTRSGPAPLSLLQEQLWYFSRLEPNNLLYNEAATIRKEGPFDVQALRVALTEIGRRHEILRSTFELVDGEPMQVVHPAPASELPVVDISGMPAAKHEREAARIAAAQAKRPYDLARGPLTRGLLVRFAADHHRLYLALHQLVFDCVSLYRVILPELVFLYDAASAGREPSLPEPPIQYADYAAWLRERAMGTEFRHRIEYWRHHLGAAPGLQLPRDHPRPPKPRFQGAIERPGISRELADELRSLARAHGATLFQVLSAAFTVFLHRLSGQDEIVFGTLGDLRDRPQLEDLVGYCVTPMVVCADVRDDPAFSDLVGRLRGDLLAGLSHLVPFGQLVSELRPRREPGANPIFQAALVLQPPVAACDPSWSIHQMEPEAGNAVDNAKFDLQLELDERPDGHFAGRLIYSTDLFTPETAARMGRHWTALLQDIAAAPSSRVSELCLLTEQGRHRHPGAGADIGRRGPALPSDASERRTEFAAPCTALEEQMAGIWARILRVDRVGVHDDFFELGGDSLMVMRLLVEVERRLGDEVPLAAFVEGSVTVAGLATTIEATRGGEAARRSATAAGRSGEAAARGAIPIQPQGTLPILFFALADERSLLTLRHFTGPLGPDQPVLGLLPDRVDRRFDRSGTVEDLAAPMLETVREAQPHGPYFFAGYSLGGMFAYEMAGRLRAAGEPVAWLGLLDTCTAAFVGRRWRLRKRVARGWKAGPRAALSKIEGVAWREITALLARLSVREPKLSDAFDHRGALRLAASYSCLGHDAPMDLFATDDTVAGADSDSLGWSDVHRGPLKIHRMGGDHASMFDDPYVGVLSEMVTRSARDALHAPERS
jgi:thioesterase domain-containing protein/acyl carrier protein